MKLNIKDYIPHRYPFLLVDKLVELESGKRAVAYKAITYNEPFFQGHFPQQPVVPGVLIIEALAQTGCAIILSQEEYKGKLVYLGKVTKAIFSDTVVPGDTIKLEVDMIAENAPVFIGKCKASVEDRVVLSVEITFVLKDSEV